MLIKVSGRVTWRVSLGATGTNDELGSPDPQEQETLQPELAAGPRHTQVRVSANTPALGGAAAVQVSFVQIEWTA